MNAQCVKPSIRGNRVTVGMGLGKLASGQNVDELLAEFPDHEREDVTRASRYAAWRAEEREVVLTTA